jgi:hypothetical protein
LGLANCQRAELLPSRSGNSARGNTFSDNLINREAKGIQGGVFAGEFATLAAAYFSRERRFSCAKCCTLSLPTGNAKIDYQGACPSCGIPLKAAYSASYRQDSDSLHL